MSYQQEMEFAIELAQGAGRVVMEHFGRVERLTKTHAAAHAEAVTEADRASRRFIVERIRQRFPGDGVIGEESDSGKSITFDCPNPAGRVWVIDPIDGTNNYVAGLEVFAVCIALFDGGWPVAGVVYDVCRGIAIHAARGGGCFRDGRPVRALTTPMSDSSLLMLTSNLLDATGRLPGYATRWYGQTHWKIRNIGSAALEAAAVAAGVAHAAITVNGKLWDAAAPAALVLEAGGIMTDLKGNAIFPFDLSRYAGAKVPFLAAGSQAHAAVLEQILANP